MLKLSNEYHYQLEKLESTEILIWFKLNFSLWKRFCTFLFCFTKTRKVSGWPKFTDCTDFFCNPKIVRIVRIFILEIHRFLNFHSFQQIFHENFKNNSRQNEVRLIFCILNNIRLINFSIDSQNSLIIFENCPRSVH